MQTEINPNVDVWEEKGRVPRDVYKKLGDMGFFGIGFDEKYGGLETDFFYRIILIEELNKCYSGGAAAALLGHSLLALEHIQEQGSKRLKEKYLKPGISGDKIGCLAITEPHAGSDVAALLTKQKKKEIITLLMAQRPLLLTEFTVILSLLLCVQAIQDMVG